MTWVDGLSSMDFGGCVSLYFAWILWQGSAGWKYIGGGGEADLFRIYYSDHGRYDGQEEWGRIDDEGVYLS
jgi:hypothetical protein